MKTSNELKEKNRSYYAEKVIFSKSDPSFSSDKVRNNIGKFLKVAMVVANAT